MAQHDQVVTAARWRTSSYSGSGAQCVEVAATSVQTAVRDSKAPGGGQLTFSRPSWLSFARSFKRAF